jgi:predicted nucleic acid-binding protein
MQCKASERDKCLVVQGLLEQLKRLWSEDMQDRQAICCRLTIHDP